MTNENRAQQVYVQKGDVYSRWVNGRPVTAYKLCPGELDGYRHINVASDEVLGETGENEVLIEKHY